jgi:hypothetical protein
MPVELMMHVEEYNRQKSIESDEAFSLAYYNAAWQRSKRMPKLERLLEMRKEQRESKHESKEQTPEQMLAMAMRLNARNGGLTRGGEQLGSST